MHSLPQHFGIHSFQIDFRILHNLRGVFRTISNIYDAETPHYWQVRFCCLVFIIFLVWILEWVYDHLVFLLKVCSYFAHLTQIKNIFKIFYWFPNHLVYIEIPWSYQIFIYLYDRGAINFEKFQDGMQSWYMLLIKIITKTIIKTRTIIR